MTTRRARPERPEDAFAAAGAATTFCVSYALQRLAAAAAGEMDPLLVVSQEHIPYTWRVAVAAFHALLAALLARWLTPPALVARGLARPWLFLFASAVAAAAMIAVP